jgi:hypothetical protein
MACDTVAVNLWRRSVERKFFDFTCDHFGP